MLVQEWEAFTGLIVSDTKHESAKDIPNWIEPDRTPAILLLKVIRRYQYTSTVIYIMYSMNTRGYVTVTVIVN